MDWDIRGRSGFRGLYIWWLQRNSKHLLNQGQPGFVPEIERATNRKAHYL